MRADPAEITVRQAALPPEPSRDQADSAPGRYLATLGRRIRDKRALRGMSRKVLARVSGISERYIAQLEAGRGNVSILLLRRVAGAIGTPLDELLSEDPEWSVFRDLLRGARPDQVAAARAALTGNAAESPDRPAPDRRRVALIGLRGAGKSTLGRAAAEKLGWPFFEINGEIERATGLSAPEIFALYGQEGYRRFERAAVRDLASRDGPMIVATGGGIVSEPVTFDLLLSAFRTIWLKARPEEHMARVRAQGDLRPMADDRAAMDELRTILRGREPFYARAEAVLDTAGRHVDDAARRLSALLSEIAESGAAQPPAAGRVG